MFGKRKKEKGTGMTRAFVPIPTIENYTIENYMKSHTITNISNGTEELWDESMGEIPWEYYKMIVVDDDGEGNIVAKHFIAIS